MGERFGPLLPGDLGLLTDALAAEPVLVRAAGAALFFALAAGRRDDLAGADFFATFFFGALLLAAFFFATFFLAELREEVLAEDPLDERLADFLRDLLLAAMTWNSQMK